jgi:hypothetical protein
VNLPVENLNPYQKKLLDAFEASISATGFTVFLFRNPKAPNLMLSRNPTTPQIVPVLVAGISIGDEEANLELGGKLYLQNKEYLPLTQAISDKKGFWGVITPYLFYKGGAESGFLKAANAAARELADARDLTDWIIVKCYVEYITKDGLIHYPKDYMLSSE